jgi:uncharacterized lipoprotein YddW (UPF0748 family)
VLAPQSRLGGSGNRRNAFALRAAAVTLVLVATLGAWSGVATSETGAAGAALADYAASYTAAKSCETRQAPRELRGMWLTTVRNIDWPSRPGLPEETVKAEYRAWLDLAVRMNHNAVFVHIRPSGDAFWPSKYAPWSYWLTGRKDGADPGWDPLAFAVAEAHARNLEFHAWFNPYKASQDAVPPANYPHREWVVTYPATGAERHAYFDPGIPEARAWVEDSILEAVQRYDLDGVHFDDFFYPYPKKGQPFPDSASYAQHGAGMTVADFRRHNVDLLVQETNTRIKAVKPWVKFGISPFGIWRNSSSDPSGSATRGLESYTAIYADSRRWVREGWLDYIVPQLYWNIGFDVADYAVLLRWWTAVVQGTQVQLYIGQADYRVGQSGAWSDPGQLQQQLTLNRAAGVQGSVHFSAKSVRTDKLGAVTRYRQAFNPTPALVPAMGQLPADRPAAPTHVVVRTTADHATVTWRPPSTGPRPARYAIYRAGALAATVPATTLSWTDDAAGDTYCVTALDRLWNES